MDNQGRRLVCAIALAWWIHRRKRTYIRAGHYETARRRKSFAAFWRYYNSIEETDLVRFLRLTKIKFDEIYFKVLFNLIKFYTIWVEEF